MKILALDTATECCSAALWLDGALQTRADRRARGAGELILPMIEQLLLAAAVSLASLDALAFGRGPGSFTGVRLAASVAQGLAFAAELPVIPISDLRALAAGALSQPAAPAHVLVCLDARMSEVYWGCFERHQTLSGPGVRLVGQEAVSAPAQVRLPEAWAGLPVCAAGSGFGAYAALLQPRLTLAPTWEELLPHAREIALLAAQDGLACAVAAEAALPVYLRDNVAHPETAASQRLG